MASNPYVNKVEFAGQTVMDISGDTVTPSEVLDGVTFHDRSGAPQTGSVITHNVYDGLDSTSTSDALSANQGRALNSKIAYDWNNFANYVSSLETGANAFITRFGKMRSISFQGVVRTHTEDELLATLPESDRPTAGAVLTSGNVGSSSVVIRIAKDGKITLYSLNGVTTSARVYFGVTYAVG